MLLRVAIFDKDNEALDALNYGLSCLGHEVVCNNAPHICSIYHDNSSECPQEHACADVLLIDNNMNRMTGLEFIRQQNIRGCKGIVGNKAVMLGDWSSKEVEIAEQLGCKIFSKPIDIQKLFIWLDERKKHINRFRALATIAL